MSNNDVEDNSLVIAREEDIYVEASSHSEFGDHSQIESGPAMIKRNKKFLLDWYFYLLIKINLFRNKIKMS